MQLESGTLLHGGTYKIERVLGQGSFGITYLAEHTSLGKKVAIKEFFMKDINSRLDDGSITGITDGSLSYNYAQKFRKEAMNLARMEHPNIVRVTDSFDENGTFYYVMDYIDGQNLNDYLKQYAVSEKVAVDVIKDVANALIYMHEEKNMLHLDLKPGNIMRRASDGHIFLIDFGLSKHYDNNGAPETSTTIGLGTAGYAPIEQSNQAKNGEFRPTIDVYALGATLYKLLTRETPPAASELVSDDELVKDSLQQHGVSGKLASVIVKAMMPNVRKRIQTIRQFMEMLPAGSSSIPEQSVTSVESEGEGTIIINAKNEETELVSVPQRPKPHPDFTEESYHIDSKYSKFPTSTKQKAESGDLDAAIAYGMMALRGQGVSQDIDEAYEWFVFAYKKGDDRGEKIVSQWSAIRNKYNSSDKERDDISKQRTVNTRSSNDSNSRLWIVGTLVFIIVLVFVVKGCNEKREAEALAAEEARIETLASNVEDWYGTSGGQFYCMVEGKEHYVGYGIPDGQRTVHYSNGDTFVGTVKGGCQSQGKYTCKNGDYFDGTFACADYVTGYGKKTYGDGSIYEGNWKDGRWHGKGTLYLNDHTYRKSRFKNGEEVKILQEGTW